MAAYPWIESYPDGMRRDAELALELMGRVLCYREFGAFADGAAKGLEQLAVGLATATDR